MTKQYDQLHLSRNGAPQSQMNNVCRWICCSHEEQNGDRNSSVFARAFVADCIVFDPLEEDAGAFGSLPLRNFSREFCVIGVPEKISSDQINLR